MIAALERRLLHALRVPPPPDPPAGGHVQRFRPARNFYRYAVLRWAGKQLLAIWGFISALYFVPILPDFFGRFWIELAEYGGIALFIAQLPFTFLLVALDCRQRWYLVTDRSLRIRHGVFRVEEKTMSFGNVQNLEVRQGPLQRLLGLADVEVRTAGGGGQGSKDPDERKKSLHVARFEGVDRAEEIKALILDYVRKLKDAGLGDPGEAAKPTVARPPASGGELTLAAAREVLAEVQLLREAACG